MKHVQLSTTTRVNGALRSPAEGPLPVADKEADRLIGEHGARDVTKEVEAANKPSSSKATRRPGSNKAKAKAKTPAKPRSRAKKAKASAAPPAPPAPAAVADGVPLAPLEEKAGGA